MCKDQQLLFNQEKYNDKLFCHVCKANPPCRTCEYLIPARELHKWCDEVVEFYRESQKTSGSIVTPDERAQTCTIHDEKEIDTCV